MSALGFTSRLRIFIRILPRIAVKPIVYKYGICFTQPQCFFHATGIPIKNYCSKSDASQVDIAYYDEIKDLPHHPEKLLIDVREPEEIKETGKIPTSINIPLKDVSKMLASQTSVKDFENLFGRSKPHYESSIIFSCKSGKRAFKAYQDAGALGYKNSKVYAGSWLDWATHEGLPT